MKLIPLSETGKKKGLYFAQVDDKNYDWLIRWKWHILFASKNVMYAVRTQHLWMENKKRQVKKMIYMHRQIMNITDRTIRVDHRDHDGLNCQEYNLRIATHQQNLCNKGKYKKDASSKYIGVYFDKRYGTYWATVNSKGVKYHVGTFKNEEEAAIARDLKAKELHGEFAYLNFP